MLIEVTQYYRPDGRQKTHEIEVDDSLKEKYEQISTVARLTVEQLMNGTVSTTIECAEFDFDIVLSQGAKQNKEAIIKLINRFDLEECKKQIARLEE